jgi:hypothetical protein
MLVAWGMIMPESKQDLREKVAGWLEKEGYPLEMKVAHAFRRRNFRVQQGHFFKDPNTDKVREIDVLASRRGDIGGRLVRVVFIIECKWSKDKPWVVFTDSSIHLTDAQCIRERSASHHGRRILQVAAGAPLLSDAGLFFMPEAPAYGTRTALTDNDRTYEALSSVTAATNALVALLDPAPIAAVFFPVIVLDGRLFGCDLAPDGTITITERSTHVLVWRRPMASAPRAIVHLVTLADLDRLVEESERTANELLRLDAKQVAEMLGKPGGRVSADDPRIDF